ncbi:MAG: hypothetical protein GPJ52_08205 [Candidatus Heimdallarchaeota archaeon]|nr:hypothetical protein [Candidatus Heimdallarchaeota archaeon]
MRNNKKTKRILFAIVMLVFVLSVFTETRVVEAGNPGPFFSVSILAPSTCPARNQWPSIMVEELPTIGIGIDVFDHTGWAQISPRTWGYPGPYPIPQYSEGGFDILFVGWGWGLDIDMKGLFDTPSFVPNGDNFYQYSRPEMDWAIGNYSNSYLVEERIYWAKKIQEYLYEDVPAATITYPLDLFAHDTNLDASSWSPLLWDTSYQDMANWSILGQSEFRYATPADFEDFHTMKTESVYDAQWTQQIYGGLVERTSEAPYNNTYAPYGATTYSSADGLTYDIQINPNLVFADGSVCNASDVEYSYNLLINPNFGQPDFGFYSKYITNESVVINSEFEVTITFNQSYVFQDCNLAVDILPKHIWEGIAPADQENQAVTWATDDTLDSKLMGIGPYYLHDYDGINGIIHLKANTHWTDWGGHEPQNFNDIYFEFWSNKEGALSALAAGTIDMVDSQFSPQLSEIPVGVKYELVSAPGSQEMAFNNLHPIIGTGELCPISSPESGKHIRKAMSHIIPRQKIVDEILNGLGIPGVTPWPRAAVGFDETLKPFEYNRNLALKYMKLAGYDVPDEYFSPNINLGIGFGTIMGILSLVGGSIYTISKIRKNKVNLSK